MASCRRLAAQRIDRGSGERAAAAPALDRDIGKPSAKPGERFLSLGGADKADREAEDHGGPVGTSRQHLEEMEERRRRVADRDHRPGEMRAPKPDRSGAAGGLMARR